MVSLSTSLLDAVFFGAVLKKCNPNHNPTKAQSQPNLVFLATNDHFGHLSSSKHPDTPYLESSCSLFPLLRESKTLRSVSRQIAKMEDPRRRRTEEEKNRELAAAVANLSIHSTAMDPLISKEALEGLLDYLKRKGWALDER